MRISRAKLKSLYESKRLHLKMLLSEAGVSKTAYYHLLYKDTLLPDTIHRIAQVLEVRPSAFLEEISPAEKKVKRILFLTDKILANGPLLDRENVRHTLILLDEKPIERLRRSLIRGRKINILR
jgi:transcriptional regulator with XRE-family HTH domain